MHDHDHEMRRGRLVLTLALTGVTFLAEFAGGLWTGSLALLSDSAHVFMDVFALGLSYLAIRAAALPADDRHTYGFHRMQVLAALANGATLLLIAVEIMRHAWYRLREPVEVLAGPMLLIATVGLVVNLAVALILRDHDHDDLNTRSAFLHVISDALASVGVIVAGVLIMITGKTWLDPLMSLLIGVLILFGSGRILKKSIHILAEGVPEGMTATAVGEAMRRVAGVNAVHDLHVWTVCPGRVALSAHVLLDDRALSQTAHILEALKAELRNSFGIEHTTIQFECGDCRESGAVCMR